MSRFTSWTGLRQVIDPKGHPVVRDGLAIWMPMMPLHYDVGAEGSGETITVPSAHFAEALDDGQLYAAWLAFSDRDTKADPNVFFTDLGSIPKLVRNVENPAGQGVPAFLLHDYLYWNKGVNCGAKASSVAIGPISGAVFAHDLLSYDRKAADGILKEALEVLGVHEFDVVTIYGAVRLGGSKGWGH